MRYITLISLIVLVGLGAGCVTPPTPNNDTLLVTTSFYPLHYFTSQIAGDKATVTNLTPAGIEPHDYELTPQDLVTIQNSAVLVLNGGQLEPWADTITSQLSNHTTVVVAGADLTNQQMIEENEVITDPHVWLSPILVQQQIKKITLGLIQADADNAAYYLVNEKTLLNQLAELDSAYKQGLSSCTKHEIITSHTAFAYLANDYGLEQVAIAGLSPEAEPTPTELAEVVQFAQDHQVHYIFFESLVSPKLADTIATEVGAQTLVLNPLEGLTEDEITAGQTYFTIMQENLTNLRLALQCQ